MLMREVLLLQGFKLAIVPVQLGIAVETILIKDVCHTDEGCALAGEPTIVHLSLLKADDHVVTALDGRVGLRGVYGMLHDFVLVGLKELIPEEGLQRVEVQTTVTQEVHLDIRCLQVLLVDTVHDEHIVLGQFNTSCLHESEGHQLQTDHVVALHLEVTSERQLLRSHFNGELHLRGNKLGCLCIVLHLSDKVGLAALFGSEYCRFFCLLVENTAR